jgi:predicted ATP-dependent protease
VTVNALKKFASEQRSVITFFAVGQDTPTPQKYSFAPTQRAAEWFAAPLERAQNLPSVTAEAVQLVQLNATILAEALRLSQPL